MPIKKIHIPAISHPLFSKLWEIYETSFPLNERRSLCEQIRIFTHPHYHMEAWTENGENILGLMDWWDCPGMRYIEHYAINPEHRSAGYGRRFLSEWMSENNLPVILEIEPVTDEITQRRLTFYTRLGFKETRFSHWHPSYHDGSGRVELCILTYPQPILEHHYQLFRQKLFSEIIPKMPD